MSKLEELRQHGGSFPGALVNVLEEFEARLKALETHAPMLDKLAQKKAEVEQAQAEVEQARAAQAQAEQAELAQATRRAFTEGRRQ